jgi:hypothetical protein
MDLQAAQRVGTGKGNDWRSISGKVIDYIRVDVSHNQEHVVGCDAS